jgi:uncharacterized coiled-coil protein SlyX
MSNPDGFMVKGKMYPAKSIRAEIAMSDYIEELEEKLIKLQHLDELVPPAATWVSRIKELQAQVVAQNKEIKVVHTLMKGLTGKLAALIQESE